MIPEAIPETEGPLFHPPALRRRVRRFRIQEHVYFQAYWKIFGSGRGPAVILYLFGIEALKFDIYGRGKGHYHVNPNNPGHENTNLLWLPEANARSQIERTLFELDRNLSFYLLRNADSRIRELDVDREALGNGLAWLRAQLEEMIDTVPELSGL